MPIRLICLDADDTLWGHESYFQEAARAYEQLLAPEVAAETIAEKLTETEDRNLHIYGYGVKGFTLSMLETALEILGDRLDAGRTRQILDIGRDLMRHPIELLAGVAEALGPLAERAPLALVTKGDLFHQEMKLAASGLGDRFASVDIVSEKTQGHYERVFRRHGVAPHEALMAGNSLRSDIWPALAAGAWAAFVPSPYEWARDRADDPTGHPRFRRLASLTELPAWIDSLDEAEAR
jgi:putative hydrolase of the HAD superfamily